MLQRNMFEQWQVNDTHSTDNLKKNVFRRGTLLYTSLFPNKHTLATLFLLFSGSYDYIEEDQICWGGVYMYKVRIFDTMVLN